MKKNFNIGLLLIVFIVTVGFNKVSRDTNEIGNWSPDARVPGYLDDTFTPFLAADQNGVVHAFVSQRVIKGNLRRAIVYRQWSHNGGWTRPVDVILDSQGDANFLSAYLDSNSVIHVVYTAGEVGKVAVYYSYVQVTMADVSRAWSLPIMVGEDASSVNSGTISGDGQGNLVILYSGTGTGNGVYAVTSQDSGSTWSRSSPVFLTNNPKLVPYSIKTFANGSSRLSAVWAIATSLGVYDSVYYVGLSLDTNQWDTPILLEKRINDDSFFGPSYPSVVDNGEYIIVMYNSGNPFSNRPVAYGRPIIRVRLSRDGGRSWDEAIDPFPLLQGNSGEHALVIDSNNIVHALVIMRIDSTFDDKYAVIGGVWYSEFEGSAWSNPNRFVTSITPVSIRAVISQGNVILATWSEDPGAGQDGVWYSYSSIDAPELPVVPLPTIELDTVIASETTVSPTSVLPTENTNIIVLNKSYKPSSPSQPLIWGIFPVVVVIFTTIIFFIFIYRRKSR